MMGSPVEKGMSCIRTEIPMLGVLRKEINQVRELFTGLPIRKYIRGNGYRDFLMEKGSI